MRYFAFALVVVAAAVAVALAVAWRPLAWWAAGPLLALAALGVWDLVQPRHSLLRNYPLLAHLRWMFEGIRPEIRQYLIESDQDAVPFSREHRSIVYQRAKNALDKRPFGTRLDVYAPGYECLTHSLMPAAPPTPEAMRVTVGGAACKRPYSASVLNISAMSFGALSAHAIRALNKGAALAGCAHDTGEGGISAHHRAFGGDLIWEIGSGYFGCRDAAGRFDAGAFAAQATDDQVKMIEIKLSQGAKPGHGGVLPGAKVTPEIAAARGVPVGVDCISPARHSAFSTPLELIAFIERLRTLSGGKPVGFKLCVGKPWEFMAIVKAMLETGSCPDFIVVDGKEGGTGAAPLEFVNRVGVPLVDGLVFVRNVLVGSGLRPRIRIGASGKLVTAFFMARALALGADWCNTARGFMFALGCIQAQSCHTNRCPVGVATQDPTRQRALVIDDKATRVANFHRNSVEALAELIAAVGASEPGALRPWHLYHRRDAGSALAANHAFAMLEEGALLGGGGGADYAEPWARARASSFTPAP